MAVGAGVFVLTGCPDRHTEHEAVAADTLTQYQRDSILGESALPGASAVKKALKAADAEKAKAARMDSLLHNK